MTAFASDRDRARGLFLAAAAGDALGWPQEGRGGMVGGKSARESRRPQPEFISWLRNNGSRFLRYQDPVAAGAYSDDTQLLLAVARSCLSDDWAAHLTRHELPAWLLYQRGGGRAVLAAANAWAENRPPWAPSRRANSMGKTDAYYNAGANGVAMRIAPHVLWSRSQNRGTGLNERVVRDGITTHGHPRALVGALAYAAALDFALDSITMFEPEDLVDAAGAGLLSADDVIGWLPNSWFDAEHRREDFATAWHRTNDEMARLLDVVRRSLRKGSMSNVTETLEVLGAIGEHAGSGTVTAAAAIYLASRSGTRPISGLLQGAFQHGADTDTLASMVGAILGAMHGHEWLGPLHEVQDAEYLLQIADALISGMGSYPSGPAIPSRTVVRELERDSQESGTFPDGRRYGVTQRSVISERPWTTRFQLQLHDGQTAIVDQVHRTPPQHPEPGASISTSRFTESGDFSGPSATERLAGELRREAEIEITIPVPDISVIAEFYGRLLGASIPIRNRAVRVSAGLRFAENSGQPPLWNADARFNIVVGNLDTTAERLNAAVIRDPIRGDYIMIVDPDGRSVTVRSSKK